MNRDTRLRSSAWLVALAAVLVMLRAGAAIPTPSAVPFAEFESGQVRPLAMTSDGTKLLAVNTPNNTLDIFVITSNGIALQSRVPVGLEPVAVAAVSTTEAWVVNHLSDSVSVVSLAGVPRVTRTLLVGDEPRDVVLAGSPARAFISTAHRGQHRTSPSIASVPGAGDPQLTTEGVGRADVWVFDPANVGTAFGGRPLKIMTFFSDTPRALAVSPDKRTVYVAAFKSGNQTTVVPFEYVCRTATPCTVNGVQMPGNKPGPTTNFEGKPAPETAFIVKYNNDAGQWQDELGRNWSAAIKFTLPDLDVFSIDTTTLTEKQQFAHVGTTLFNMVTNPVSGKLYVSNTDANNQVRFEGPGIFGGSTVQGNLAKSRITVISGSDVIPRHLNKHIDYSKLASDVGFDPTVKNHSLATPLDMAVSRNGQTLYVTAFGSSKIGVFNTAALENNTFNPRIDSARYINVSGGGPSGLVLDESRNRLYVLTRFDNALKVINLATRTQVASASMPNPEPQAIVAGRPMLYDANLTSANGEASCSSCHIFGDKDEIAWDLGNPDDHVTRSPIPLVLGGDQDAQPPGGGGEDGGIDLGAIDIFQLNGRKENGSDRADDFHSMKGPMTTQTMRGMKNSGHMHWRGDRAVGFFGTDGYNLTDDNALKEANHRFDSELSFKNFIVALGGLNGKATPPSGPTAQDVQIMDKFAQFQLRVQLPPNPVRNLDNSLTPAQLRGRNFYFGTDANGNERLSDGLPIGEGPLGQTCNGCHTLNPADGHFGTSGRGSTEGLTQVVKIAHLRNLYDKVGMFGSAQSVQNRKPGDPHLGPQVRGFGFIHDGTVSTLNRFLNFIVFQDLTVIARMASTDLPPEVGGALQEFVAPLTGLVGFHATDNLAAQEIGDMEQFLLAFDSDLPPIVGQQVTLNITNRTTAGPRIDLLKARAAAPFVSKEFGGNVRECDLVAHVAVGGRIQGLLYNPTTGDFHGASGARIPDIALRSAATSSPGSEVTYTCTPPGSGARIAFSL